jgi:hypothetical protein
MALYVVLAIGLNIVMQTQASRSGAASIACFVIGSILFFTQGSLFVYIERHHGNEDGILLFLATWGVALIFFFFMLMFIEYARG